MIDVISELLVGKDNEEDIKRYGRIISLYAVSMVASGVRCTVNIPSDNKSIPINLYNVAFADSGIGKTRSLTYVLDWIKDAWNDIKQLGSDNTGLKDISLLEELQDLSKDGITVSNYYKSMTDASLTRLMRILDIVDYGSVNYVIDEFSSNITKDYELLSSSILEIYDNGKLPINLRATTKTKQAENSIPLCMLAFGSQHLLFESNITTEKMFFDLLVSGLARRCLFVDVASKINRYVLKMDSDNTYKVDFVTKRFRDIVKKYDHRTLSLTPEARDLYFKAHTQNIEDSASISDFKNIEKIYAKNKHWIALKLSGVIAVSNLHEEVTYDDYKTALEVVNDSEKDLVNILNRKLKYELFVDYLLDTGKVQNEYNLTQELPFFKDIRNKKQFMELAKGYAYMHNITLQIQDKKNITFYSASGKTHTDLDKPIMFSYSTDMTQGYYTNNEILFRDLHKVVSTDNVCYSAHSFKGGHRKNENAIPGFQLVILDIDEGVSLETAKILFNEYTYLIATTKSHQKEKNGKIEDRFRIILPMKFALELDSESYSKMMKNLFDDLPIEVDRLSDIARFFYGSKDCDYWYNDGQLIDCDKYVDYTQEKENYDRDSKNLSKKNLSGISQYVIKNQYNGRNSALIKLALLLMDMGYSHNECKAELKKVNQQFDKPLSDTELAKTIFKTIEKKEEKVVEEDSYEEEDDIFSRVDK